MSPRAKQQLYYSLAQLLRAGMPFPHALEKLSKTARGPVRATVAAIQNELKRGSTVTEACAAANLGSTEASVLSAVERSGALDRGLSELAEYYGKIAVARGRVISKLAYPLFVLILAGLLLTLPKLVQGGREAYFAAVGQSLSWLVILIALSLIVWLLVRAARVSSIAEGLLQITPFGGLRRSFAMSRFCLVYDLQLSAGINVIDALAAAARSSESPRIRRKVQSILPRVREGQQPGPLLAAGAVDPEVAEAIIIGEESGNLGAELRRVSELFATRAFGRLEALAEWLPRLFYVGVLLYVGYQIVKVFEGYIGLLKSLLE